MSLSLDSETALGFILYAFDSALVLLTLETALTYRFRNRFREISFVLIRFSIQYIKTFYLAWFGNEIILLASSIATDYLLSELFFRKESIKKVLLILAFYAICLFGESIVIIIFSSTGIFALEPVEQIDSVIMLMAVLSRALIPLLVVLLNAVYKRAGIEVTQKALLIPPPLYVYAFFTVFNPLGDNKNLYYNSPILFFTVCFSAAIF